MELIIGERTATIEYVDDVPTITHFQDASLPEDFPNITLQHGDFVFKWPPTDREPVLVIEKLGTAHKG